MSINNKYKFTATYWDTIAKNEHYFKDTPLLAKFKGAEYLNSLKNIYLENSYVLKTDLYVEAKNEDDNFLPFLKNNHFIGMDISFDIVKMARQNLISIFPTMKFAVADIRCLPFRDNIFQTVISDSTLAYIPKKDLPITIMEVKRILKAGGNFILSLNNMFNFLIVISSKIRNKIDKRYFFSYSYNYKYILKLIKNVGFTIEHIKFSFPLHIFEFILIKILYKIKFNSLAQKWIYLVSRMGRLPLLDRFLCSKFLLLANKK